MLYAWLAFCVLNALAGFRRLAANCLSPLFPDYGLPLPRRRTAILIPIYNEDVEQLSDRLRKMTASIQEAGGGSLFDFFILSDSHVKHEGREYTAYRRIKQTSTVQAFYLRRRQIVPPKP